MSNRLASVERNMHSSKGRTSSLSRGARAFGMGTVFAFAKPISARAQKPWPRVEHTAKDSAWAGPIAVMVNWKNKTNESVSAVIKQLGDPVLSAFQTGRALTKSERHDLFAQTGLVERPVKKNPEKAIEEMLLRYGPLMVLKDNGRPTSGGFVVVGIKGSGEKGATKLEIIDTATGKGRRTSLQRLLNGSKTLNVVHWPVDARLAGGESSSGLSYDTQRPEQFGKKKETTEQNEQDWYSDWDLQGDAQTSAQAYSREYVTATQHTKDDAKWAEDAYSPDYNHLGAPGLSQQFNFSANDLEKLCNLNSCDPAGGQDEVIFGLRGCKLVGGNVKNFSPSIALSEDIPNHYDLHCVVGVWKRSTKQLTAFNGSTVPNWRHMERQLTGAANANMLPTGFYSYRVGKHRSVEGAFIQNGPVVVIRSNDDLIYEITDDFDKCHPGDNIHPGFRDQAAQFSSAGCQTVPGGWSSNAGHYGDWADFRASAGLARDNRSKWDSKYNYALFTGRDARLVAAASDPAKYKRLRFGSSGPNVKALQLGLKSEGLYNGKIDGDLGAGTLWAYVSWQKKNQNGKADAIVDPKSARSLGFDLIKEQSLAKGLGIEYSSSPDRNAYYLQSVTGTFAQADIDRMKKFFVANAAAASPKSCIGTMNEGLRLLLNDPNQKVGSAVHLTMDALKASGHATSRNDIEFLDANGRVTKGVVRPDKLSASVLDEMLRIAKNEKGWSVFGLSILDGYHSVTLSLDNNNPEVIMVYWSDQWATRKGWQAFTKAALDAEITKLTQQWWDGQPANAKHRTRTTLWRILP
ncbi:MAG: peptidoglycan-binding protein [Proteobacteria bacterium]|nr:peptidoglycan-binding protein [Pseudomonadota bacterium]